MTGFRGERRKTSLRGNIFLVESVTVFAAYVWLLHQYGPVNVRSLVLSTFGFVYMVRLNLMSRWLLPRDLALEEITFVTLVWIPLILASFALAAVTKNEISCAEFGFALLAYGFGSYLNTWSELQRKWWKEQPQNCGRCYTQGLFAWSRNINYLGDVILFAGWASATDAWWNVWVPVTMFLAFYFHHIPDKEKYLAQRYKEDWASYASSTKAFVPFLC